MPSILSFVTKVASFKVDPISKVCAKWFVQENLVMGQGIEETP